MTLHILQVSPWSGDAFERCCAALAAGDALLLLGDGVYAARAGASAAVALGIAGAVRIHVLGEDCAARGIDVMCAGVIITDYPGFVALAAEHDRSVTWL